MPYVLCVFDTASHCLRFDWHSLNCVILLQLLFLEQHNRARLENWHHLLLQEPTPNNRIAVVDGKTNIHSYFHLLIFLQIC